MHLTSALLAHQGGWDEILFVIIPILAVVGLLALLKRRVERNLPASPADTVLGAGEGPSATAADRSTNG